MMRAVVRPSMVRFFLALCACALVVGPRALAQSQGVGLTVESPSASATPGSSPVASASPQATAAASGSPSAPGTTSTVGNPAAVQGNAVTPATTSGDPLPRTGFDVLRLVAIGLGLVTVGDLLLRTARRARAH